MTGRDHNIELVLTRLVAAGPQTRSDLVAATGLTKATVASIVAELRAQDLVVEGEVEPTGHSGRPSRPVSLAGPGFVAVGVDAGAARYRAVAVGLDGEVEAAVAGDGGVYEAVQAVGATGLAALATEVARPAIALARQHHEAGRAVLAVHGGRSVTAGLVTGGRRPERRDVDDVGHLIADPGGDRCPCGRRGCWQTVVGVEAILRECAPERAGNPLAATDPAALGVSLDADGLERISYWLRVGLDTCRALLNPDTIVLGGYLATLGPWPDLDATLASPDPDALATGAALLALDDLLATPSRLMGV